MLLHTLLIDHLQLKALRSPIFGLGIGRKCTDLRGMHLLKLLQLQEVLSLQIGLLLIGSCIDRGRGFLVLIPLLLGLVVGRIRQLFILCLEGLLDLSPHLLYGVLLMLLSRSLNDLAMVPKFIRALLQKFLDRFVGLDVAII